MTFEILHRTPIPDARLHSAEHAMPAALHGRLRKKRQTFVFPGWRNALRADYAHSFFK